MTIQVTLISEGGYRPLSTLLEVENWATYQADKRKWNDRAIVKICGKRYMTAYDLKKYGYTTLKARPYDLVKGRKVNGREKPITATRKNF